MNLRAVNISDFPPPESTSRICHEGVKPSGRFANSGSAKDNPGPKTNLAVSSTEFCQSIFGEDQILGIKAWQPVLGLCDL
jgi:hypothetical protein